VSSEARTSVEMSGDGCLIPLLALRVGAQTAIGTRRSRAPQPRAWPARQILAWLALIGVAAVAAYALEVTAESPHIVGSASPPPLSTSIPNSANLNDPKKMFVIIWFNDPARSGVTSIRCITNQDRVVTGVLETYAADARELLSAVCDAGSITDTTVATT
jgi:hypothetical protein